MFEQENIDSRNVVFVSIFGAFAVFVAVILVQVVFYRAEKEDDLHKASRMPADLARYQSEQQTMLNNYRWLDKPAGRVAIPIEQAMRKERQQLLQAQATP